MVDVSVVIVCMNRPDNLYPCLESVFKYTTSVSFEVLVVAYLYDKDSLAKARTDFPKVRFIESDEIRGFAENNNLALEQAQGRYCFVLNDDTVLTMPVIDKLVQDFALLPPKAAILSPKIFSGDGSLQLLGRPEHNAWHYILQQFHLWNEKADNVSGQVSPIAASKDIYPTSDITGAAFLIRTDIFRKMGWFDETYFFTPEDMALSTQVRTNYYGVYVDAGCSLIHKWKTTSSRMLRATRPAAIRGSLIFFSGGIASSGLRYLGVALPVWIAESLKRVKARAVLALTPASSPEYQTRRTAYLTFRNITRSIFTKESPKDLFIKYYTQLREEKEKVSERERGE